MGSFIGEEAVENAIQAFIDLEDPDGGHNGASLERRGYGSANVPSADMDPLGYGPALGNDVRIGHEYNALDQIAHEGFYAAVGGAHYGTNPYSQSHYSPTNPSGDNDSINDNDWRRPERDDNDNGPRGANELGVTRGSGGGADSGVARGSGGRGEEENHSAPSNTGYSGRGVDDLDGPEAAGAGNNYTSSDGGWSDDGWTDPDGYGVGPVFLDLDGSGITVTEISQSAIFVDGGDGLEHRTAWAGAGDGVLFFDADGSGDISEQREYVFTEWDPTATSDLEALRSVFDTNGDGKLTSADSTWSQFRVARTEPDGTLSYHTLDALGITEIDLMGDATNIELPDGSVITGQTTFTMNGQTRTVGEMTLATDGRGYRLEETESTSGGTTTRDIEAYGTGGELAWAIHVVAATDGSNTVNRYDDDGDGIVDRVQEITVTGLGSNNSTRTVTNYTGADAATGVLENRTITTVVINTVAGTRTETIQRDSVGGGWFDQVEVRVTAADGSMTITTTDLSSNGSMIRESVETVSADGMSRTEAVDSDGDGDTDYSVSHVITMTGSVRTEVITTSNGDGSPRSVVTTETGADGRSRTISRDLDGDGGVDVVEDLDYTELASGSSSMMEVRNQDGSLRSSVTETLSEDALSSTQAMDLDGDGDTDLTVVDQTVINADGSRVHTVTSTNNDGSVREMRMETMSGDALERETWVDLDQDGVIEADELVQSVEVDAVTGERVQTVWDRNPDGSVNGSSVTVTAVDGMSSEASTDVDGDGQVDVVALETTIELADGRAQNTTEIRNSDGSLRNSNVAIASVDGLSQMVLSDVDGDGGNDLVRNEGEYEAANGELVTFRTDYNSNLSTILHNNQVTQSADRRIATVREDTDGDGDWDAVTTTTEAVDGSVTSIANQYTPDGTLSSSTTTSISADGLISETDMDVNGDGNTDQTLTQETVLGSDGSATTTRAVENGDGSLRSGSVTSVSDDGLTVTETVDADGDGVSERATSSVTTLNADGSRTTLTQVRASDANLLGQTRSTVSDDGLVVTVEEDRDGNGGFDISTENTTVLQNDGGTVTTTEVRDAANALRFREVVTTSDNGRSVITEADTNGDGQIDRITDLQIADTGVRTDTQTSYDATGGVESAVPTVTQANGLSSRTFLDADGNGTYERSAETSQIFNADGSVDTTETTRGADGSIHSQSVTTVSDDGLTLTGSDDIDYDGQVDLTTTEVTSYSSDGSRGWSSTTRSADNSLLETRSVLTSADSRTEAETVDLDGNGNADRVTTAALEEDVTTRRTTELFSTGGTLVASYVTAVSADGLTTTQVSDRDADGLAELVTTDATVIAANGQVTRDVRHRTGQYIDLARERYVASDDGLQQTAYLDVDGDGTWESITHSQTEYDADGTVRVTRTSADGGVAPISNITSVQSGNGLSLTLLT